MTKQARPARRMAFWMRTYLATLALFLACLGGGVLGVTVLSRNMSFGARSEEFLTHQHILLQQMAEDIAAVAADRPAALNELYTFYGQRVRGQGMRLAVWQNGLLRYNDQPRLAARPELDALRPGQRSWQVRRLDGRHILFATTAFTGELTGYTVSCCADIEDFYAQWRRMGSLALGLGAGVCAMFAAGLYLVLRRMYRPLGALTATARTLAGGDFSARAAAARSDELGELARTLNEMAGRVERQVGELAAEAESKQQLVDNLSHEMRTPLTAICGYAEYIQRADLRVDELAEAADTILFESRRLLGLSNQLVKLSVLTHETPEFCRLLPEDLLRRAVQTVLPKAEGRGVAVVLAPGAHNAPALAGDADLLESLLVNLADNGIKACGAGGSVTLSAAAEKDGGCVFCVRDTGQGMDAATLARIGQPFYRADKARSRAEGGAGLGVALCRAIAEAHGAVLQYASSPGRGTSVTLRCPPWRETPGQDLPACNIPDTAP